jgi:hypothetical protein
LPAATVNDAFRQSLRPSCYDDQSVPFGDVKGFAL